MDQPWITTTWQVGFPSPVLVSAGAGGNDKPLLVYLHGLGESADAFKTFWPKVDALDVNKIIPSGPFPFEKRREGKISIGHAWYLYDGGEPLFRRTSALVETHLLELIRKQEQTHGLNPSRRILMGYSMGAYLGYLVALRNPGLFSHVIGVSGNLKESFIGDHMSASKKAACLILHGERDAAVPVDFARRTHQTLRDHGFPSTLQVLPGGHGLGHDRDEAAAHWLAGELELSDLRD